MDSRKATHDAALEHWFAALERRHLQRLTFAEVRRAVQSLSRGYVEGRSRGGPKHALRGAGKRAAYALYYGPLHYLTVRRIVAELFPAEPRLRRIVDLGCGTGGAGAAWALSCARPPSLLGVDRHPWAVEETSLAWRTLGLQARVQRLRLPRLPAIARHDAILAAYTLNELEPDERERVLQDCLAAAERLRARVLILEPIARSFLPWWEGAAAAFVDRGGRADEWRFDDVALPEWLVRLDKAAGLDHRRLTARSLLL